MSIVEVVLRVPAAREEDAIAHLAEFSPGGFRSDPIPAAGVVEFGVFVDADRASLVEAYLVDAGVPVSSSPVHTSTQRPDGRYVCQVSAPGLVTGLMRRSSPSMNCEGWSRTVGSAA